MDVTESGNYREAERHRLYMREWRAKRRAANEGLEVSEGKSTPRPNYRGENPEAARERSRRYYQENREHIRLRSQATRYGLHPEWITNALFNQNNQCAICSVVFSDEVPYQVDHDHETDQPRELLCRMCNLGVGWAEKPLMVEWLAYVERHKSGSTLN